VAAGGDGTLNAVLNGLRADFSKTQLGLLPLGTGNDFARTIGIPTEINDALSMLRAGHSQVVDLIRVQTSRTRYCINVSAGGFSTKVSEKMTGELKGIWGPLSYVRSFFEALPELSDHKTEILLDDTEVLETPCYSIIIANARYVARGIPIAPDADISDGLADIVIVPTATVPQLAVLAPQMLLGKHLTSELIQFRRARKIAVRTNPPMTFNVDGEVIGDEPAIFEVLPAALRVITAPLS
jgi:diacylglycerol kinase (ATP)